MGPPEKAALFFRPVINKTNLDFMAIYLYPINR